jgi:ABC-type glycerol-3-phosphate transport system substrate-binding protein
MLAPLAVVAMLTAGCSDDNGNGASDNGSKSTTTAATRNLEGQTIEVAAVWSGTEQQNFGKVLAAFEKNTGAKVTFTSTGDDIATVLGTRLEGGDPPDIAFPPQPGLLRDLVARKALKPIDDVAGKQVDDHFSKDWKDLATVDGVPTACRSRRRTSRRSGTARRRSRTQASSPRRPGTTC